LQNAAAKAERVLTEIKADIKADFGRPSTPDNTTRLSGRFHPSGNGRFELPWTPKDESEKPHEAEFKRRILELSKRPEDFLGKIYDEHQYIDMPTAMTSVGNILGVWDIYTIRVQNMLQLE
jgi:Rab3 GTPase-activating protein catalytic subunit